MTTLTSPPGAPARKVKDSLVVSAGNFVLGMEDGAVSIFGLVFGVAASAASGHAVLPAGSIGAALAAVSMMTGTYQPGESMARVFGERLPNGLVSSTFCKMALRIVEAPHNGCPSPGLSG